MLMKRTTRNNNSTNTGASSKLKSNGWGKYKYPIYGEVPPGWYVSEIMDYNETTTKSGKPTIEVYYKIEPQAQYYNRVNGLSKENDKIDNYYIKQSYPEGTQFRDEFVDSMCDALGKDEFELEEIIGITERVSLSYKDYSNFGGFGQRDYVEEEDYINLYKDNLSKQDAIEEIEEENDCYL